VEERIGELLAPIIEELEVDLVKVSLGGGGHQKLLRVVVDAAGGVPFDVLERISRALALQLDAEDMIDGRFRLEVTSPGLDWPLESEADLRRHQGERLKVSFTDGSTMIGENLGPCEGGVLLGMKRGAEKVIDLQDVARIVREVDWKRSGGGKS